MDVVGLGRIGFDSRLHHVEVDRVPYLEPVVQLAVQGTRVQVLHAVIGPPEPKRLYSDLSNLVGCSTPT